MTDQIFAYKTFGVRYDSSLRQWRMITENNLDISNFEVVNAEDTISDEDNVNTILRSKKNSSIYLTNQYRTIYFDKKSIENFSKNKLSLQSE